MNRVLVGAVVVDFMAGEELRRCLGSLVGEGIERIVLVDNASPESQSNESTLAGCEVLTVSTGHNLGYGAAVNFGASLVDAQYLMICNPDIEVVQGSVAEMVEVLSSQPQVAIVAPKVLNDDGTRYPSFRRFPSLLESAVHGSLGLVVPNNSISRRYKAASEAPTKAVYVPWVSGACFMIRSTEFHLFGGFDPAFFMYCEDVDLCRRVRLGGFEIVFLPSATVVHKGAHSSAKRPLRSLYHHHRSMWIYAQRSESNPGRLLISLLGISARFVVALILRAKSEIKSDNE